MSGQAQILGIVLVRNEDLNVARAISNIIGFCDQIIIADNGSTDETLRIAAGIAALHPQHIRLVSIKHPRESHDLISPLAGTRTWVFGVDGDEIYDPLGLGQLRQRILAEDFSNQWMLLGNVLNCVDIDHRSGQASGYLAPPCRSITKLYNFGAIEAWNGDCKGRLHGGHIHFREGFGPELRRNLHDEMSWDLSELRCLHLCFLPRSSMDSEGCGPRENIMEIHTSGLRAMVIRALGRIVGRRTAISQWKRTRYMRGPLVRVSTVPFFESKEI